MTLDVIIPAYHPSNDFFRLLNNLENQHFPINKIIVLLTVDSSTDENILSSDFLSQHPKVMVYSIKKANFDHGATRRFGVKKSQADAFLMLTQDAIPTDEFLTEHLQTDLQKGIAVAYGRQLTTKNSPIEERCSRFFNYPNSSLIKSKSDINLLGIKTYFCSNVCAAYRRDIYEKLGGFVSHTIFNEDMIYAATAIQSGYAIAYNAEATVFHTHNYNLRQQFRRNFDLGVSHAEFSKIFSSVSTINEGGKFIRFAHDFYKKNKLSLRLPYFYLQCMSKYLGYILGKHYKILPTLARKKCSYNKDYWKE